MTFQYFTKPGFTVVETEGKIHKKTGLTYRPNTSDVGMINDCVNNYTGLDLQPGDVVFDLGANIGGFVNECVRHGVQNVYAWEPDPFNYALLEHNAKSAQYLHKSVTRVQTIERAVVNDPDENDVTFVIKDNPNGACSGTVNENAPKQWLRQTVKTSYFWDWIDNIEPNILKIDIEGGEYDLMDRPFPEFVEQVAFELHGMNKISYLKMLELYANFIADGWEVVELSPEIVFNKLQLINVVLKRTRINDCHIDYDMSYMDEMPPRALKFEKLGKEDFVGLDQAGMHELILRHHMELM